MPPTSSESVLDPIFVDVKEAARLLGVSAWTIHQLIHGEHPSIESRLHGRKRLIRLASLRSYAESLPSTSGTAGGAA